MTGQKQEKAKTASTVRHWGPFVTQLLHHTHQHRALLRSSRRYRRGLADLPLDANGRVTGRIGQISLLFAIRPDLRSWWIGTLFMIGSALFAAGSIMLLYFEHHFSAAAVNLTYFVGSIFFTSAAYGQVLQAINANLALLPGAGEKPAPRRWWARGLRNPGFLSALSQFIGTVLFNLTTFDALYGASSPAGAHFFVWVPDMLGSILFLVSSFFAWIEIVHDDFVKALVTSTWWIVWLNIIGSILFQVSALYGYINPFTGAVVNSTLSVQFTLWGAVCFYGAAHLSNVEIRGAVEKPAQSAEI